MVWRENGEALRKRWLQRALDYVADNRGPSPESLYSLPEPGPGMSELIAFGKLDVPPALDKALEASKKGDMFPLAAYLRSDHPFGPNERERLARHLMIQKDRKNGRPQNTQLRAAANAALFFYDQLRAMNKKQGLKDHGLCSDMKDYAARAVVEDNFFLDDDFEWLSDSRLEDRVWQVRELMDKTKTRRDPRGLGLITFKVPDPKTKSAKTRR